MHPLRGPPQVVVRAARGVEAAVVMARRIQAGEAGVDVRRRGARRFGPSGLVGRVERQRRRSPERRAHQHDGAEHVRPGHRAPRRHQRSEVVAGEMDLAVPERRHERQHVANLVQHPERAQVVVVADVGPVGAAVPAQVRRHDVVALGREGRQQPPPAIGELREAVQQEHAGAGLGPRARLQHVHAQAVDVGDEAGADAGRQNAVPRTAPCRRLTAPWSGCKGRRRPSS